MTATLLRSESESMSPCDEKIAWAGSSVASEKVSMLTGKKSAEKQKIVQRKIGSAIFQK